MLSHNAIMVVETPDGDRYRFLLPKEIPLLYSYQAQYDDAEYSRFGEMLADVGGGAGIPSTLWQRGKDDPIEVEVELAVGISYDIDTPEDLIEMTEKLVRIAHASSESSGAALKAQDPPGLCRIFVGDWFVRRGIVKNMRVGVFRPWDPQSGKPHRAKVTFQVQFLYDELPSNKTFAFDRG